MKTTQENFARCPSCGRLMTMVPTSSKTNNTYQYVCPSCRTINQEYHPTFGPCNKSRTKLDVIDVTRSRRGAV